MDVLRRPPHPPLEFASLQGSIGADTVKVPLSMARSAVESSFAISFLGVLGVLHHGSIPYESARTTPRLQASRPELQPHRNLNLQPCKARGSPKSIPPLPPIVAGVVPYIGHTQELELRFLALDRPLLFLNLVARFSSTVALRLCGGKVRACISCSYVCHCRINHMACRLGG